MHISSTYSPALLLVLGGLSQAQFFTPDIGAFTAPKATIAKPQPPFGKAVGKAQSSSSTFSFPQPEQVGETAASPANIPVAPVDSPIVSPISFGYPPVSESVVPSPIGKVVYAKPGLLPTGEVPGVPESTSPEAIGPPPVNQVFPEPGIVPAAPLSITPQSAVSSLAAEVPSFLPIGTFPNVAAPVVPAPVVPAPVVPAPVVPAPVVPAPVAPAPVAPAPLPAGPVTGPAAINGTALPLNGTVIPANSTVPILRGMKRKLADSRLSRMQGSTTWFLRRRDD